MKMYIGIDENAYHQESGNECRRKRCSNEAIDWNEEEIENNHTEKTKEGEFHRNFHESGAI